MHHEKEKVQLDKRHHNGLFECPKIEFGDGLGLMLLLPLLLPPSFSINPRSLKALIKAPKAVWMRSTKETRSNTNIKLLELHS
jgi:hypothetical protein